MENPIKSRIVLFFVLAAGLVTAMPAGAAEWDFYGSVRMTTFIMDRDVSPGQDTTNLNHSLQSNSRIGANVTVNDELQGRFEYGTGVNLRILYGTWNFGPGQLLVGQHYSPLNWFYSNQVVETDNNLLNYGGVYSDRNPMVRLRFGNFRIAAVEPSTSTLNAAAGSRTEVTLPKIEARYTFDLDNLTLDVAGGFNTYELIDPATNIAHDVDSFILALGGRVTFGAVYLASDVWIGQNVGPYGMSNAPADDPTVTGNTLNDNDAWGFLLVAGMKINEMLSVEAGYGWSEAELDVAGSHEDDEQSYYVQGTITFAPGVFIVPEIGVMDGKRDSAGAQQDETVYYGLKWQINF